MLKILKIEGGVESEAISRIATNLWFKYGLDICLQAGFQML
jgi:hypothetical protein